MIDASILQRLAHTLESRKGADPKSSYSAQLFSKGHDAILKKVAEEAAETLLAANSVSAASSATFLRMASCPLAKSCAE